MNICGRNRLQFVADFETNTTPELLKVHPVWLWGFGSVESSPKIITGNSLVSFMEMISQFSNIDVYFHNLKFDGEFIIWYLLKNGFTHSKSNKPINKTFQTLINDMGVWYCVFVVFENGNKIAFKDSLKRIPLKVSQIPKAYGLDEMKTNIDYEKSRNVNYKPSQLEIDYVSHDVSIVCRALYMQDCEGMTRITVGSNAFAFFKQIFVREYLGIKTNKLTEINKHFESVFPVPTEREDSFCRAAYLGGWTFANPLYKGKLLETKGRVYDVNSLYPSVMRNKPFPYGRPIKHSFGKIPDQFKNEKYVYFHRLVFSAKLKPDRFPNLKIKDSARYLWNRYITDTSHNEKTGRRCNKYVSAVLTNIDIEILFINYDVEIVEYGEYYVYRAKTGLFNSYIDYWTTKKIQAAKDGNNGLRTIAKLYLNNLYGKFGTNPNRAQKIPYIGEKGSVSFKIEEDSGKTIYIPVAAFCTAYARQVTIMAAISAGKRFLYADTDSLHILGDYAPDIPIDNYELGYWKHESTFEKSKYLGAKCYAEYIDNKWKIVVAGMPDECKENMNVEKDFQIGYTANGKLIPAHYEGGIILEQTTFQIKER